MNLILCDGILSAAASGEPICSGAWSSVPYTEHSQPGMTLEDYEQMKDATLVLFVVVFGFLALKKALQ